VDRKLELAILIHSLALFALLYTVVQTNKGKITKRQSIGTIAACNGIGFIQEPEFSWK
jgi:hypothetical protein